MALSSAAVETLPLPEYPSKETEIAAVPGDAIGPL
jgi:hypothetical protein